MSASGAMIHGVTAETAGDLPLSGTWLPDGLRRYAGKDLVDAAGLEDIPRLIRYAWGHALNFPDIGDEIMEDLQADVQQIVKNERKRLTAQYAAAAREAADRIAVKAMRKAEDISAEAIASLIAGKPDDGFNPRGCFVYLLWENKGDQAPIYVGKSTNVLSRLGTHMEDPAKRHRVRWVTLIRCRDGRQMDTTEARLIRKYRPELNTAGVPPEGG